MKTILALTGCAALFYGAVVSISSAADELKVGDDAPNFELVGSDGKTHKLADYKGKQAVVIAWFPKAFTGGCTKECESFRDNGKAIREYDVAYFTASTDKADVNKNGILKGDEATAYLDAIKKTVTQGVSAKSF